MDAPLSLASSSCQRVPVASFHSEGRDRALEEVSKLYAYVQSLPSGAQKTHFLKKVGMRSAFLGRADGGMVCGRSLTCSPTFTHSNTGAFHCHTTCCSVQFESTRKIPGTPQPYTKPSRAWKKVAACVHCCVCVCVCVRVGRSEYLCTMCFPVPSLQFFTPSKLTLEKVSCCTVSKLLITTGSYSLPWSLPSI